MNSAWIVGSHLLNRCCGYLAQNTAQISRNALASGLYDDAGTVG